MDLEKDTWMCHMRKVKVEISSVTQSRSPRSANPMYPAMWRVPREGSGSRWRSELWPSIPETDLGGCLRRGAPKVNYWKIPREQADLWGNFPKKLFVMDQPYWDDLATYPFANSPVFCLYTLINHSKSAHFHIYRPHQFSYPPGSAFLASLKS